MDAKDSARSAKGGSIAYLLLCSPVFICAMGHWAYMPKYAGLIAREFGNSAFPPLTNVVVKAGPAIYAVAAVIFCLAAMANQFELLRKPAVIGGLGATLGLGLYMYGIGLMLPLITLLETIGNR